MEPFLSTTPVGPYRVFSVSANKWNENCFLLIHDPSESCMVVDPGYGIDEILREIDDRKLSVKKILGTHAHFDHVASVVSLQEKYGSPEFLIHESDLKTLKQANLYTMALNTEKIRVPEKPTFLSDGFTFSFGDDEIRVLHTPGHTPGGCVFSVRNALFTGDLLLKHHNKFLPGFDANHLEASKMRLYELFPEQTIVFPGHGKVTTLGAIRQSLVTDAQPKVT